MKRFSKYINEACVTADINPGNLYPNTGVTNHLTPVGNIVAQIRNLFGPLTGVVASIGEDGFSVKLNSSKFTSEKEVNSVIYDYSYMRNTCLADFIQQQGLNNIKIIPIGQYYIVYFCPDDIKAANKVPTEDCPTCAPCQEMLDCNIEEIEMLTIIKEDDDEELKDITKDKIKELLTSKDKVKAAKQFELLISQEMQLPREYYFAGVKDKEGNESISLRWKYQKQRPFNKTAQNVRSLMNIFDMGKEAIWIQDYVKDSMFILPEEVKKLIDNILKFLGAKKTNDPAVWSLEESDKEDEDNDKKEDDSKDDKKDDLSKDNKEDKEDKDNKEDKDKKEDDLDNLL